MKREFISVIVPVYNVEYYLKQCLDSIVNQTYRNLEIILVDDGKIIACGKHSDLYKTVPMYRDIVDLQKLEDGDE